MKFNPVIVLNINNAMGKFQIANHPRSKSTDLPYPLLWEIFQKKIWSTLAAQLDEFIVKFYIKLMTNSLQTILIVSSSFKIVLNFLPNSNLGKKLATAVKSIYNFIFIIF